MNKNEVITLSSDDEVENNYQQQMDGLPSSSAVCRFSKDKTSSNKFKSYSRLNNLYKPVLPSKGPDKTVSETVENFPKSRKTESPEIVDLVESGGDGSFEQSLECVENGQLKINVATNCSAKSLSQSQNNNHIDLPKINVNVVNSRVVEGEENTLMLKDPLQKNETTNKLLENTRLATDQDGHSTKNDIIYETKVSTSHANNLEDSFFDKFVSLCVSLEPIQIDKDRLKKKLYKRYNEANPEYHKTKQFRALIDKCVKKLNSNNLYLLAKEVCDELTSRKEIKVQTCKVYCDIKYKDEKGNGAEAQTSSNCSKKHRKIIKKIIKQLDNLGHKIRQLEEAEVDLSDEEESSYVQLQRYRYRFCVIYKKLCKYTNEIPDANRVYNRKICFSGSKYPKINKCIEKWLNKTKRFPDFNDILKLLENQCSSLGLPSDRESIRVIATEIFHQVGVMLQQRRKYDLWDSFCGYLDDSPDPAVNNPKLENILKKNYETRVERERQIMAHFTEMQEKQRLNAEEVPEEEALNSPNESGNEDDKEIEEIEDSINKKLDVVIKNEEDYFCTSIENDNDEFECIEIEESDSATEETESTDDSKVSKQSKNNFKNCKSLKWRKDKITRHQKGDNDKALADTTLPVSHEFYIASKKEANLNSSTPDTEEENLVAETNNSLQRAVNHCSKLNMTMKKIFEVSSDLLKPVVEESVKELKLPIKRNMNLSEGKENPEKCFKNFEKRPKFDRNYDVRFCRVEYNFRSFCKINYDKDLNGKIKKEKKVRDLTKIGQLLSRNRLKRNNFMYSTPIFYYWNVDGVGKFLDNKYLSKNGKFYGPTGKKCAFNQEKENKKNVQNVETNSEAKKIENNSGSRGNNIHSSGSGQGSGRERDDNDENENKRNKLGSDEDEYDHEEEEEGEDEDVLEDSVVSIQEEPQINTKIFHNTVNENQAAVCSNTNSSNKQSQNKRKKCTGSKSPRRGRWKKCKNLVTAETAVEGEVVKAEVTLNEEVVFLGHQKQCRRNLNSLMKNEATSIENRIGKPLKRKKDSVAEPSDEERVTRFLLNSPSSISITPPKKLSIPKLPSPATLQALATLKKLKEISTKIIRKQNLQNEVVVLSESTSCETSEENKHPGSTKGKVKRPTKRSSLPIIAHVESMTSNIPKIVTVEGNISSVQNDLKFMNSKIPGSKNKEVTPESSTIKISNVWGNCSKTFEQTRENTVDYNIAPKNEKSKIIEQKSESSKKPIEYVVLD